ncbi:MAG: hypothetical protein TREMPRED_003427 [Tremellales sp. Tagirdzhanova-0007]|nr:MAG: hypothetical protein TREMPRED_003427 [Tremellales sp. Tagirdzhanova-0007]
MTKSSTMKASKSTSSATSSFASTSASRVTAASISSTSSAAASSSTLQPLGSTLMNAYYPDWSGWYLTPESVDWSKFDVVDFAFALPTADFNLEFTQDDSSDLLTRLVKTGHAAGKRVKLSIGGWTGSTYFSTICSSSANRKKFVANIMVAVNAYNLDGIDIDWEYPGTTGADGNAVSTHDSANFLLFLTELRAALPVGALISTATQVWPFADSNGNPMSDVSGFAKIIDYILIMNYDVWGSSSTPGANAPLSDGCQNSSQPLANAYAAVSSWTTAGMPANQITLGVPAYGYLQKSGATGLKDRRSLISPPGRRTTQLPRSYATVYNDNGGSSDGQVMFESLISQGALALDNTGSYTGAGGFVREWDSCSSTPWLRSSHSGQIVTYDDPQSMSLKGQFAAQAGLRGCNVFSIDGDWTGSAWPLTDALGEDLYLVSFVPSDNDAVLRLHAGPMVYAAAYCPLSFKPTLDEIGFDDSKALSPATRQLLWESFKAHEPLCYSSSTLSPQAISAGMLRRVPINLNRQAEDATIGLIRSALDRGTNIKECYVDALGPSPQWQAKLSGMFPTISFTVCPKADSLFKVVDPVFGYKGLVRFSWATVKVLLDKQAVECRWIDNDQASATSWFGDDTDRRRPKIWRDLGAVGVGEL